MITEKSDNLSRAAKSRWRRAKLLLLLLFLAAFCWIFRYRMFVTVQPGQVGVLYYRLHGGTSLNLIAEEGWHIIAPWDEIYLYNVRTQTLILPMTVLTKNGLAIQLDAQIRFHPLPDTLPAMHRQYGENYVKSVIVPQFTEAVQQLAGQFLAEELYSPETGAAIGRIVENGKRIIGGIYVNVDDIALFNIRLPGKVQEAIQNKAEAEQEALAHAFRVQQENQESRRKMLEAKGLQQYATHVSGIPRSVLVWKGIEATLELAKSPNSKVVLMGSKEDLPLMLGKVPDAAH